MQISEKEIINMLTTISSAILIAGYWNLGSMIGESIIKVEEHVKNHIDDIKANSRYNYKKEAN